MRRNSGGGADERRGRSGALWTAGFACPDSPAGASRWGCCGFAWWRVRGLPALAQCLCSMLQVYPEPRSESECLSNIREFLRGCGASLRLEVSGSVREGRGAGVRKDSVGTRALAGARGASVGARRSARGSGENQPRDLVRGSLPGKG